MKKSRLFIFISMVFLAGNIFADSIISTNQSSTYVNLNTGIGKFYDMPTGAWTANMNWGYNFNRGFALEGGYNFFYSSEYGSTNVITNIVDVAAKGTIPLSDVFGLYGRAGVGVGNNSWTGSVYENSPLNNNSVNSTYGVALVGVGGTFSLSRHWDLRLEDTIYVPWVDTTTGTMMALTFGTQYKF